MQDKREGGGEICDGGEKNVTNEALLVTFQNLTVTNKLLFVTFQNLSVTKKPLFVTFQNLTVVTVTNNDVTVTSNEVTILCPAKVPAHPGGTLR